MNNKVIGVDIGATKIHAGLIRNGKIIKEVKFPTNSNETKQELLDNLIGGIESLDSPEVVGIGIGVPGMVDEEGGIIYDLMNIPAWKEVHLKKHLENFFKKPIEITNDANVFVLGEKVYGKGRRFKNIVGITMGTGFGMGIIINDQLYSGSFSSAGELGSVPYLDHNIESYCSGKYFVENFGLKGFDLFKMAEKGDKKALDIFKEYGTHLGNTVKLILYTLSPEAIFMGGSVNKSYKYFKDDLMKTVATFPFKRVTEHVIIQPSETKNAAILGAAALIVQQSRKQGNLNVPSL